MVSGKGWVQNSSMNYLIPTLGGCEPSSGCSSSGVEKRMLSLWAVSWNTTYVLMTFMQQMNYECQPVASYLKQAINVLTWLFLVEECSRCYGLISPWVTKDLRNSGGTLNLIWSSISINPHPFSFIFINLIHFIQFCPRSSKFIHLYP